MRHKIALHLIPATTPVCGQEIARMAGRVHLADGRHDELHGGGLALNGRDRGEAGDGAEERLVPDEIVMEEGGDGGFVVGVGGAEEVEDGGDGGGVGGDCHGARFLLLDCENEVGMAIVEILSTGETSR